jgi:hypothetical protein
VSAQLKERREKAQETIESALAASLKDEKVLPAQVKRLLDGASGDTLRAVIKLLAQDEGVMLEALEASAKQLERQV